MFRTASARLAALISAAVLTLAPSHAQAQKALVYCPVGIDATGCNTVVTALAGDATRFPGGADAGYDGTQGTVDLASVDLSGYAVFVVPSLADGPDVQPYALLRNGTIAGRIKAAFMGRTAVWSGTPDVGSTNRAAKNELIRNLAGWARADSAGTHGPGVVALQDNSDAAAGRYGWLSAISVVSMAADTTFEVYSNVQVLTATGRTILTNSGGLQIGYTNMASYGLVRGADGSGATDEALGGRTSRVVLVTAAGDPSDPNIATVRTDKEDYQPGDTVTVTGSGWEPGETVSLLFHEDVDPPIHPDKSLTTVADSAGHIVNRQYEIDESDLGVRFTLTATGETSGRTAQATFTDATHLRDVTVLGSQTTNPVIAGSATTFGTTAATSVQVRFNGNGTCTVTLSASGLPSGATASFAPSTLSGTSTEVLFSLLTVNTTAATTAGTTTFTVRATGTGGGANDCPTTESMSTPGLGSNPVLVVAAANQAPVLGAIGNKTVNELATLSFTATATDADTPAQTLTFSLDAGAPSGASITAAGAFSWTPTEAQGPGDYPVTVRVTDSGSPAMSDFETISIHVNEVNVAPVLAAIGDKTVNELATLSFTASATDADLPANTLTFSLVGAPAGASITAAGGFSWTPTEAQGPGDYTFAVKVTDNGTPALFDDETITVHVNEVNAAPVLTGVPPTLTTDELVAVGFDADATDGDTPAQTLNFSLVGGPSGATIDPTTGVFAWTPSEAQGPGSYPFQVQVSDGVTATQASITITVREVNVAPELAAIGSKAVDEETALTFTATATDADVPANSLAYSLTGTVPSGAAIGASSGVFTWTPTEAQGPGSYTFTVKVMDNGTPALSDEETITVTVNEVNKAPVVAAIPDQTVDEETALGFTASATDPDVPANSLAFSLSGAPAGASINPATGVFSWTPTEAQGPGVYTFQVRATDDGSPVLFGETTVKVTVQEVNRAPALNAIGNKTADEEAELSFTASATDPDLPANTLSFSLVGGPAGATIDPSSGVFSWTPTEAQGPGDYSFTVKVADNGSPSLSDEETITVHVNEVNVAPVLAAVGNKTVDEETALTFTASATDHDVPANSLAFSLDVGAPTGASIDPVTGAFSWTPGEADGPGDYPVTIRVTDNGTPVLDDFETISIHVNEVNKAPTLNAVGNQTVGEETALTFTATASDPDLPANTLTFSLVGAPAGASISAGGAFSWTPTEAQGPGDYSFTVKVTDNGVPALSDDETISVHVNEVNKAPVFEAIADQVVDELTPLSFTATAADPDIPANSVTYSLSAGPDPVPAGASINSTTGAFTWTPTEAQGPGTYTFKVVATDNGAPVLSGETGVKITVNEVNVAPVLASIGNQSVNEETPLTFTAGATDADLPANGLTFSLVGGPVGASIGATSGAFTWTPTEAQGPGDYTFTVKVTDNGTPALSDDETITVHVNEVNRAPVVAAIPAKSVSEASTVTFTATATDPDLPANTLAFSLVGAPAGATINATTGAFTWTPVDDDPTSTPSDVYTFKVRATDNGSPALYGETTVTITVNNVTPVLAALSGPLNPTAVGTPVAVSATFGDVGTKDSHTGVIDWGDGTTSATVVESNGSGTASGSHSYSSPNVYSVKLTVSDDDGGASNQSTYQYVVVYDPAAGFVTGGGWIDSPANAYRPDPSLTGKANFGFVAKYQKGKSVPDGNTEFQFKAGNLNFKSTTYEWLVISGAKGQYKGYGTVNGLGNYRFVLTIEDGELKGTGVDKFRIRIWNDGSDLGGTGLVYDNQYGDAALGDATTALGGGSLVIHSDAKTASK
jgi:hypothetical protein